MFLRRRRSRKIIPGLKFHKSAITPHFRQFLGHFWLKAPKPISNGYGEIRNAVKSTYTPRGPPSQYFSCSPRVYPMVEKNICAPKKGYFYSFLQGETPCTPLFGHNSRVFAGVDPLHPPVVPPVSMSYDASWRII